MRVSEQEDLDAMQDETQRQDRKAQRAIAALEAIETIMTMLIDNEMDVQEWRRKNLIAVRTLIKAVRVDTLHDIPF